MCYTQTCFGNFDTCTKSDECAIYKFVKLLFDLEMLIFKFLFWNMESCLCCIYASNGFFDPYTMVVYHGGMFVYADDNIVGYTDGLCDIFKDIEVMSIMNLDKLCEKLGYEEHVFYWYVTPGKLIEN